MRNLFVGRNPGTPFPFLFNHSSDNFNLALVLPNVFHYLFIPGFANLSASVEVFQAIADHHQHNFSKDDVRQHEDVVIILTGHIQILEALMLVPVNNTVMVRISV